MKYIQEEPVDETVNAEVSFNRLGQVCQNPKDRIFAKSVTGRGHTTYYLVTHNGILYDPLGAHSTREQYLDTKMRRASKNAFDYYLMYLQTNNSMYMTRAQRSFINE
jgi:hypothetical protein